MPANKWGNPIRGCLQWITELDGRVLVAGIIGVTILTIFWGLSLGGLTLPAMCIIFVLLGKRFWKVKTPHEESPARDEDGVVESEERKKRRSAFGRDKVSKNSSWFSMSCCYFALHFCSLFNIVYRHWYIGSWNVARHVDHVFFARQATLESGNAARSIPIL
mgnify:CR=1 FL=1